MSINYWRYKDYTDDGCSIYQCLKCYGEWEGRGAPGYHYEGKYNPTWRFCPICGTQWLGMRLTETPNEMSLQLGPRRARIDAAIERRRQQDWTAYYAVKPPAFWWSIQTREFHSFCGWREWVDYQQARGLEVSAYKILEQARSHKEYLDLQGSCHHRAWDAEGNDIVDTSLWKCEVRVVRRKSEPKASFEFRNRS